MRNTHTRTKTRKSSWPVRQASPNSRSSTGSPTVAAVPTTPAASRSRQPMSTTCSAANARPTTICPHRRLPWMLGTLQPSHPRGGCTMVICTQRLRLDICKRAETLNSVWTMRNMHISCIVWTLNTMMMWYDDVLSFVYYMNECIIVICTYFQIYILFNKLLRYEKKIVCFHLSVIYSETTYIQIWFERFDFPIPC